MLSKHCNDWLIDRLNGAIDWKDEALTLSLSLSIFFSIANQWKEKMFNSFFLFVHWLLFAHNKLADIIFYTYSSISLSFTTFFLHRQDSDRCGTQWDETRKTDNLSSHREEWIRQLISTIDSYSQLINFTAQLTSHK